MVFCINSMVYDYDNFSVSWYYCLLSSLYNGNTTVLFSEGSYPKLLAGNKHTHTNFLSYLNGNIAKPSIVYTGAGHN